MTDLLTGNLLVASTLVTDPIYSGGVCLIVHQDDTNVIGVMLNRPMRPSPEALLALGGQPKSAPENRLSGTSDSQLHDASPIAAEASDFKGNPAGVNQAGPNQAGLGLSALGTLHFGGPLSGPVVAIHQLSQYAEAETGSGIFVAAQKQHLEDLVRRQPGPYRLIVGHLGWETAQLEKEIESGIWHVVPATVDVVFATASEMWPGLIRRATSNSMARWIGVPDGVGELN